MDATGVADISEVKASNDVCTDDFGAMVLAPIHIRSTSYSGGIQHVSWLDAIDLGDHTLAVLTPRVGGKHLIKRNKHKNKNKEK